MVKKIDERLIVISGLLTGYNELFTDGMKMRFIIVE